MIVSKYRTSQIRAGTLDKERLAIRKTSSKVIFNSFNINVNIVLICNDIWFDRSVFI